MNPHYYYICIVLGCLSVPFFCSFHPWLKFYKQWKALAIGIGGMMLLFIPWDIGFTHWGIWGFNDQYLVGLDIVNLPLEEWLFFICIPYACVFTFHCFQFFFRKSGVSKRWNFWSWWMVAYSIVMAFMFHDRTYTFVTHLFCAVFTLFHLRWAKSNYLPLFNLSFLVLLIPFIISNGFLTGIDFWNYSFINLFQEQISDCIVWYNSSQISNHRFFSIPIEDFSYGYTMLLMVTSIYEKYVQKKY